MTTALQPTTAGAKWHRPGELGELEEVWIGPQSDLFRLMIRSDGACILHVGGRDVLFLWGHYSDTQKDGARRWARWQLDNGCPNGGKYEGDLADFGVVRAH